MAHFLYHTKSGTFIDIKRSNTNTDFDYISITEEEKQQALIAKADKSKLIKVIDNEMKIIENEFYKRSMIVDFKNNELAKTDFLMFEDAQVDYELTDEDIEELKAYRKRLRFMDDNYDESDDKQSWKYVYVEVYTSGKNTDKYQILKPSFLNK